ncbi:S49 family peptidase [Methyloceanibacter sp.]|uniref:S49 family peptidase n=1 Tax=Methyloceanibacter sp. TaxID=1965321 RepID=UPI002D5FFCE0|nr:S49 family peptidase [Methyloceanibacter sp.]HZP09545.1 S49 family peptidase [Methyloceanibacter sp.]
MNDLPDKARSERADWLSYLPAFLVNRGPVVPVLRFSGPIGMATPLRPGLSLSTSAAAIDKAFSMRGAKAVAIQINSPGGSAVQSMLIYKRIRALAAEKGLKVYVFAEDVAASGGYLLALAGDEIYADPSSIIGSIGVITATFGLNELIAKIGVQRRVYTAGKSKDTLDPFLPEKPEDVERIKSLQRDVHSAFIDLVKERRGAKIEKAGDDLFTGEFWSGKRALELGLIDGLSDVRSKMRALFGDDVRLKLVMPSTSWLRRKRSIFADAGALDFGLLSHGFAADLISAIEARALWSRFGL